MTTHEETPALATAKKPKRRLRISRTTTIVAALAAVAIVGLILAGYTAYWTGFNYFVDQAGQYHPPKWLWDWLELLIVPAALAGIVFWLNHSERKNEFIFAEKRAIQEQGFALDRVHEERLQSYLDQMAELLEKGLQSLRSDSSLQPNPDPLINIARVRTLTVLRGLDGERKGLLLRFLFDSMLIQGISPVSLQTADLSEAVLSSASLFNANLSETTLNRANLCDADLFGSNLTKASLQDANLSGADLTGANLSEANLTNANLSNARLGHANLNGTNLTGTNLSNAYLGDVSLTKTNLSGADLSGTFLSGFVFSHEQLVQVKSLKGALMPNGTKHE